MHQRVHNRAKVPDLHVAEFHRCRRIIEIDLYALIGDADRPEQAARSDTGVEVVDLIWRDYLPLIQIQSNEAERATMPFPIHPNVNTLHETHIDVEDEGGSGAGLCVCGCPRPLDLSGSN